MRAPAKPPQREGEGAGEEGNGTEGDGGGEGEKRAGGKAKRSGGSGGGATTIGARKKKHQCTTHANAEDSNESKIHDAPDWSIQGGVELGPGPRTGSSGGEPDATDWSVQGNGENTTKRLPGLEHPGQSGARPKPPDWIVRGRTRFHGLEHPRQRREYDKKTPRIGASGAE